MAEGPLRLFIAVPVPPRALESCVALLAGVRAAGAEHGARWVRTENLHITVRFLGDTEADVAPDVAMAMTACLGGVRSFRVTLSGAGVIPSEERPRSLWLGVVEGATELAGMAGALEAPLDALGWAPSGRPFKPHLTVGRTDAIQWHTGAATAAALIAAAREWEVSFAVDRVVLYRSHLGGGPPRYEPLAEVMLAG